MSFRWIWSDFFFFGMKGVIPGANDQFIFINLFPWTSLLSSKRSNQSGNSPFINTRFSHQNFWGNSIWIGIWWWWEVLMPKVRSHQGIIIHQYPSGFSWPRYPLIQLYDWLLFIRQSNTAVGCYGSFWFASICYSSVYDRG